MPVLHYYPVIGGLETWTQNIAERLSSKAEILVVTGRVLKEPSFEIKNGVRIFRASLFSLKNLSYSSPIYILMALPFLFLKSLNVIKRQKINLLHCQGFLSGFLGFFLSKLTKTPYIVTVQRIEEDKGFLRKLAYKNAKICIAASSAIKEYFDEIGCKNIEIIPNGIDLSKFQNLDREKSREKLGIKDEFLIMTVARLEKVKGINYLIEAGKLLSSESLISNSKFLILIIGDGSERKNLENLVKKLNLEDRVKFLGQIPNEEILEYLVAADCFVLPSLKEGFGIVILEAMAAGVPIIGTKIGGILDIIDDQKTGILVEPKNPQEIAGAIFKIYTQPQLSQNLVKSSLSKLIKYDWQNVVEKVYQIYQQLTV